MSLVLFDQTLQVTRIIGSENIIEDTQVAERDGLITHTVEARYDPAMDTCVYFGERDPIDRENFWLYRVTKREKSGYTMTLDGMHKFFDDLKAYGYIKEKRPHNVGFDVMIDPVLSGTGWTIGEHSVTGRGSQSFYYTSRLDAFWKTIEAFHVEFKLHCSFENGKITSQVIDFADTYDEDHGRIYVYGDKLLKVEAQTDDAEVFTAFVGRGKGVQKESENPEQESPGYSRKITFADVEWTSGSNPPIHKPKGQEYIEIPEATAHYGYPDGSPRIGFVEFDDIEDPLVLVEATYLYALEHSHPQVQFKADVYEPEHVSLYEVVGIKDKRLGILYKTRVFKVTRSFLNPAQQTIEFGAQLIEDEGRAEARAKRSEEAKKIAENELFNQRMITLVNAYGNHVYHGSLTPQNPVLGDIWFRENPDGTVDILVWDGTQWSVELNEKMFSDLRKKVDEAEAEAQAAVESAQAFIQQVDDDVAKAGFSSLGEAFTSIQDDAKTAIQKASDENIKKVIATENYVTEGEINTKLSSLDVSGEVAEYLQNNEVVTPERFKRLLSETEIDDNGNTVTGQLASIEMMATGIQTVVSDMGDDMSSRITQLNDAIQTKVSSSEMESRITQAENQITLSVKNQIDALPDPSEIHPISEKMQGESSSKSWATSDPSRYWKYFSDSVTYFDVGDSTFRWHGLDDAIKTTHPDLSYTPIWEAGGVIRVDAKSETDITQTWQGDLGTCVRKSTSATTWGEWEPLITKEGLMAGINIEAGGVSIFNGDNKLNVTPETTYIANSTITNAMIKDATIDTAKIRSIDASNGKIVNIDAGFITSGWINAGLVKIGSNPFYIDMNDHMLSLVLARSTEGYDRKMGVLRLTTTASGLYDGIMLHATNAHMLRLGVSGTTDYDFNHPVTILELGYNGGNGVCHVKSYMFPQGTNGYIEASNTSSDIRLKEDIKPWDVSGIDRIKGVEFIRFKYKDVEANRARRYVDGKERYGISAQSAMWCSTVESNGYYGVDTYQLSTTIGKATQELIERVEQLEAENAELKERLLRVEQRLDEAEK